MVFAVSILASAAVSAILAASTPGAEPVQRIFLDPQSDTVTYPSAEYKLNRKGDLEDIRIADSLLQKAAAELVEADTLPHLTARDTLFPPDSLQYTDPFRYKYYVALIDSLTRAETCDSLMRSAREFLSGGDSLRYTLDSLDCAKIDSIYVADSTAAAIAAFQAWYNSLSKKERHRYDAERKMEVKMAQMDSLEEVKAEKQAVKDSIIKNTPRILETFAIVDSMQYRRLISWKLDKDFHKVRPEVPDTSFNLYYHDYPFLRNDVNATWLGDAGTPVQTYNYFKRKSILGEDFYTPNETWTYLPETMPQYNTKTPYTELAYWGTLLASRQKASDNVHVMTTQNITPEWNTEFLFDRWGTGGWIQNELTKNSTVAFNTNYLGKKYLMHAGYIHHDVYHGESGGIRDDGDVRDTIIDSREMAVALSSAASSTVRNSFYVAQQLRIPFNFINDLRARKDSTFEVNADSLDRNITSAFVGHTSEYTVAHRNYIDNLTASDDLTFYKDSFYAPGDTDHVEMRKLDNRVFLRLQPWSENAVVSKIDVGVGDLLKWYADTVRGSQSLITQNNIYAYAGIEGQISKYVDLNAKAHFTFAGYNAGDFDISADISSRFYPFRRHKDSPFSIRAHFETRLDEPTYYQQNMNSSHFKWANSFKKSSTTKIEGFIDIPHWKLDASVGYALLGNNLYYDKEGIIRQNETAMSVLSASLRKEFVFGRIVHLDNRILAQFSSNQEVLPLPMLSFNLRYFLEFVVQRAENKKDNVLVMQVGTDIFFNTKWNSPAWNPAIGVFMNQDLFRYNNGPYFDVFINMQWKRACIFIKLQNTGQGWPMKQADYFSAAHYIVPQRKILDGLKLGIYWPLYMLPFQNRQVKR